MQYIWLIWSLGLLLIWLIVYLSLRNKKGKREMLIVSLGTTLFGLTEPLFVPEYWNPPSLFNLAQRTGFDIESLIFSFSVGGLAVIIYEWLFKAKHIGISETEKNALRHSFHFQILFSAPILFILLLLFSDMNPIYVAFISLMVGGLLTWYCRPDLKKKMIVSALLFTGVYFLYFLTLDLFSPGYVEQVWNLPAISGILVMGVPLEELLFAFGLGFLWSSVYEHIGWYKLSHP